MRPRVLLACLCPWFAATRAADEPPLVSQNGQTAAIPGWHIQSAAAEAAEPAVLSRPGFDPSSWQRVELSRCTVLGCLVQSGVHDASQLFYSDNLQQLNAGDFQVPWLYRHEFTLQRADRQHFHLQTHGISSKADLFLNGVSIATKDVQSGAYGGHTYDISSAVASGTNALVVRAHPVDYNYDFAVGFVDWNPHPPDRGMGVWRPIEIRQTGPVMLGPLVVGTILEVPGDLARATVTLRTTLRNLEETRAAVTVRGAITSDGGGTLASWEESLSIGPGDTLAWSRTVTLNNPAVWWPKQWGEQPLHHANLTVLADSVVSDADHRTFGIRNITSTLNPHNDTAFAINGLPFQVVGAGYASDLFLHWDGTRFAAQCQYALDLGLNTLRLEGKMEQPELYEITDRLGLMVLPGWECCDKWEAWSYNSDYRVSPVPVWNASDYETANASMRHEALMLQSHPSVLGYLVGSDYWPDDRATAIYLDALQDAGWQTPIISSASKRGYPEALGPSGMKMDGPYDWVPPNYWFDAEPSAERVGAAFGFGSELGAGVGTPELGSLQRFLSPGDMDDLWRAQNKTLFHLSLNGSQFDDRAIYNDALWKRYGGPASLEDYLLKSQVMDYEATRAQFEAFAARRNAERPATGLVYWMFNNAWPSLHWNLFDYFLHPAGSYFGTKVGCRIEHVAYDYARRQIYLINRSRSATGSRTIQVETLTPQGQVLHTNSISTETVPNTSKVVGELPFPTDGPGLVFLRLRLLGSDGQTLLSRNTYWLAPTLDTLDWDASTWYYTPVSQYADFSGLFELEAAQVSVSRSADAASAGPGTRRNSLVVENHSPVPAFFIRLGLVAGTGDEVTPVFWSDNYVTVWPQERITIDVGCNQEGDDGGTLKVQIRGANVAAAEVDLNEGWTENRSLRLQAPALVTLCLLWTALVIGLQAW